MHGVNLRALPVWATGLANRLYGGASDSDFIGRCHLCSADVFC